MTEKIIKMLQRKGIPDTAIVDTRKFLEEIRGELLYLTMLSPAEYRVMFRLSSGKSDAKIFNVRIKDETI